MRFCWIPAGEAQLGYSQEEIEYIAKTQPQTGYAPPADMNRRKFQTNGFWLGKYEVTQAEWAAVMDGKNPSSFTEAKDKKARGMPTERFPVEFVSWEECLEFLARATAHDGTRKGLGPPGALRLPSEDEWEYACRGGLGNKQPFYFGKELNGTQANVNGTFPFGTTDKGPFLDRPCAVDDTCNGKYPPHPWGLMHMHGNVAEWCADVLPGRRPVRGGSFAGTAIRASASATETGPSRGRNSANGFRVFAPGP
jgi:formylglycine-generating enzyme required for sulfatase activity